MPPPPDVVAFDVVETLFALESLTPLLVDAGGDAATLEQWFNRLLRDGFALTAASDYRSFTDVARAALRAALPAGPEEPVERVLAGLADLDVHPDSAPAMGRAVMGARVIVVTNGSRQSTRRLLEKGGLDGFVEAVVSAEDAGAWKPAAAVYQHAASTARVAPEALGLVSAHAWDVHGARRAGLSTGWCNRLARPFPAPFESADVEGPDLLEVVERLLGAP